jgi:hypothetical protein
MIRIHAALFALLLAFSLSDSYADTYAWTDEQGTVHFTGDLEKVPANFRNKARMEEESTPTREDKPASPASAATGPDATPEAGPVEEAGKHAPGEIYGGKTFSQWEKDFRDREAAATDVRKRIVEITELVAKPTTSGEEKKKLLDEYTSLLAQFNEMKTQYHEQVEIARKSGLRIDIE